MARRTLFGRSSGRKGETLKQGSSYFVDKRGKAGKAKTRKHSAESDLKGYRTRGKSGVQRGHKG